MDLKGLFPYYGSISMVLVGNMRLFPDYLIGETPLTSPLSQGEQIWCLNINFISFRKGYMVSIALGKIELRSHGPIHNSGHLEYR